MSKREEVVEYCKTHNVKEAQEYFGLPLPNIYRYLRQANAQAVGQKTVRSPINEFEVLAEYWKTGSVLKVAEKVGCTHQNVSRILAKAKEAGICINSPGVLETTDESN